MLTCMHVGVHQGDALDPTTYNGVLSGAKLVVSTIGTLLESDWYKKFIR